jgi:flagellar hook-associated protein 2
MASSTIFSGSSRYAADFAQVIERSVAIASLPLTQLGSQRSRLSDQESAVASLAKSVSSLRSAVKAVDTAKFAISVSTSDGAAVGANADLEALPGKYTVQVLSTGSRTTSTTNDSLPKVSDYLTQNISTADSFTLYVNSSTYTITPTANNLAALAAAINEEPATGVQAVVLNLGTASNPDYRISVQSTTLGPVSLQLEENDSDPQSLLTGVAQGTFASYRINGQPVGSPIDSATASQIEIAPGVKVDLLKAGTSDIVVQRDSNKLSSALTGLAAAYNSVVAEIDRSRGASDSPLNGHSILSTLSQVLRRLTAGLPDLGFSFSDKGVLSFSSAQFGSQPSSDALRLIGSLQQGGFLAEANEALDMIEADSTGLLPTTTTSIKSQIAETDRQIAANQDRLDLLRQRLATQMAASDALIGMLEQQVSYMTNLFESMRRDAE